MGIARRKAGTVVRCPTCAGQVVVPEPGPAAPGQQGPPNGKDHGLFERSDFEELFQKPAEAARVPVSKSAGPAGPAHHESAGFDVEQVVLKDLRAPNPGIFLTTAKVTLLSAVMVLLLGLAFFAGLLIGRGQ
jgi:hypothetical protein